jgi:hypothetical protein
MGYIEHKTINRLDHFVDVTKMVQYKSQPRSHDKWVWIGIAAVVVFTFLWQWEVVLVRYGGML